MANLQYMPGDPRLVDQLVYELKSKGIFDQFRKDCIADVDTRPAYQNLRQRVESSVSTFLSRQCWKPDLNKNQLREKLRKHILDGNYLEQGVERIVDQVVNPKVATVFIPQVEDLVYNYLGITRKKAPAAETTEKKPEDLLPTDLEAVSPGSVKSNDDKNDEVDTKDVVEKMEVDQEEKTEIKTPDPEKKVQEDVEMSELTVISVNDSDGSMDKSSIPLPAEEIKLENIPAPVNSPPKAPKVELENIALPHEPNLSTDIPLPDEILMVEKDQYFKPIPLHSEESNSSSDSSLRRNMSPLTPIRNFINENSCDAQQGFENDSDSKSNDKQEPSSFRFTIESNDVKPLETNSDIKADKKETDQTELSYQFTNQININTFNTPMYDDSSNSNNLQIDYESDINSKTNTGIKPDLESSQDSKREKKSDDKKSSHKSSHRSRDSSRHSSSKDKRSDSKHSTSRDSSRHDKKSSSTKDESKSKSSKEREKSKDRSDKKESRDTSKHRSSHKSSSSKDSKHKSSSSSHRQSSKSSEEKKSSTSKDKEKVSDSSRDKSSKDKSKDSKSSSHRSDKDKKSGSSSKKPEDKDKKKDKKDIDDHYSSSGRGNHGRRSTDRDSNDGSSSSKGSQHQNGSKSCENKKESKGNSSKSDNASTSGDSASPSDKEHIIVEDSSKIAQFKPIVRVDNHLETPIANPPRLPFVPDVTLKKPRFAANLEEARKLMKMRKFLDEEQKRMNQEAALLLEFQANVRPSLSQVYSSIPGPELEFACVTNVAVQDTTPYEVVNVPTVKNETEQVNNNVNEPENSNKEEIADVEVVNVTEAVTIPKPESIKSPIKEISNETSDDIIEIKEAAQTDESESIEEPETEELNSPEQDNTKINTYDENKPFSELMDEITEYSKASENKIKSDIEDSKSDTQDVDTDNSFENTESIDIIENTTSTENKYFEVTIITEELSETEDMESENIEIRQKVKTQEEIPKLPENELQYFAEHEKYNAELERHEFSNFLKVYMENVCISKKMYLINCDTYEENIVKEAASTFGDYEIINYYKNGHLKLPATKNIVKDVSLTAEITLPLESDYEEKSPLFSPVKSECSFELSSDYDAKLDEITKKSRQEVMEIILGSVIDESPSKMPKIDYYTECMDSDREDNDLKRRIDDVESTVNNNISVLTPNKIRKLSESDQISSTTEETEEVSNNNKVPNPTRSKYLGRARRVGLPRPKRCNLANSPSSDKSVENYAQNSPQSTPNGKIKTTRSKVQRYDTSDLYKPKLHYLSRRNNIS